MMVKEWDGHELSWLATCFTCVRHNYLGSRSMETGTAVEVDGFRINARTRIAHGMSKGAVYNTDGHLVGRKVSGSTDALASRSPW